MDNNLFNSMKNDDNNLDDYVSYDRNDYVNNYNNENTSNIDDSNYNVSFENQLNNSEDINLYQQQSSYNQNVQEQNMYNMNSQFNYQNYDPNMYNDNMYSNDYGSNMYNDEMYNTDYNSNMYNNNMYANGYDSYSQDGYNYDDGLYRAEEITTEARRKERNEPVVRTVRKEKTSIGSRILLFLFYTIVLGSLGYVGYSLYARTQIFYFNKNRVTMLPGTNWTPITYVKGKVQENKTYSWSSADDSVATVDDNGKITAEGIGKTKIKVIDSKTGNNATIDIDVSQIIIKQLEITEDAKSLKVGEKYTLTAMINGRNGIVADYIWTSNDPSIASVDGNGTVKGIKKGRTKVNLNCKNTQLSYSIYINVN